MQPVQVRSVAAALGPHAGALLDTPPAGARLIPAEECLREDVLRSLVQEHAERTGMGDALAAASIWNKHYNWCVASGPLAAATLLGVGLDASLRNVDLAMVDGLPKGAILRDTTRPLLVRARWPAETGAPPEDAVTLHCAADLWARVHATLFADHLRAHVTSLHAATRLPPRIAWSNIANLVAHLHEQFAKVSRAKEACAEDRHALLESPTIPSLGENPLRGQVRYESLCEEAWSGTVRVREVCCLRYRLPNTTTCYTCPRLSPGERAAILQSLGSH